MSTITICEKKQIGTEASQQSTQTNVHISIYLFIWLVSAKACAVQETSCENTGLCPTSYCFDLWQNYGKLILRNTSFKNTEKYIYSYLIIRYIETWMLYAEEQATKRAALSGVPSDEDDLDI